MSFADGLPSLNGLRSFLAAAKHESFTLAAKEIFVTPGAVNRLVRQLEDELGVRLFDRAGRSIKLTPAGASYYQMIMEAFQIISSTTQLLRSPAEAKILRINAPGSFALRWLVPRLHSFNKLYPEIIVDITTKGSAIDFAIDKIDIAITFTAEPDKKYESVKLLSTELGIFCSPEFSQLHQLHDLKDLEFCPLISTSSHPNAWAQFFKLVSLPNYEAMQIQTHSFEHPTMAMAAAIGGMGVALLPLYIANVELNIGQLYQPFKEILIPEEAHYIEYVDLGNPKIGVFRDWLLEQAIIP